MTETTTRVREWRKTVVTDEPKAYVSPLRAFEAESSGEFEAPEIFRPYFEASAAPLFARERGPVTKLCFLEPYELPAKQHFGAAPVLHYVALAPEFPAPHVEQLRDENARLTAECDGLRDQVARLGRRKLDFRLMDVLERFEQICSWTGFPPEDEKPEPIVLKRARAFLETAIERGVAPNRVVAMPSGGVSLYFFPGGHAPSRLERAWASVSFDNDGGAAMLLSNRSTGEAFALDFEPISDLDSILASIVGFLRDGTPPQ